MTITVASHVKMKQEKINQERFVESQPELLKSEETKRRVEKDLEEKQAKKVTERFKEIIFQR